MTGKSKPLPFQETITGVYFSMPSKNLSSNSDSDELTSFPIIEINAQPTPITTIHSTDSNFNINATLSDNGTDIGYQWQLDGNNVTDGTVTKSTVELLPGTTEKRVTKTAPSGSVDITYIPVGAQNVQFNICGGAGGSGGGNFANEDGANRVGGRGGYGRLDIKTKANRNLIIKIFCSVYN